MFGLSGMQIYGDADQKPKSGRNRAGSWRKVPAVRERAGSQAGPVRSVYRLQQLSRLQIHQAENGGCKVSGRWWGTGGKAHTRAENFLRMCELSGLQICAVEQAGCQGMSGLSFSIHAGKIPKRKRQFSGVLQQGMQIPD